MLFFEPVLCYVVCFDWSDDAHTGRHLGWLISDERIQSISSLQNRRLVKIKQMVVSFSFTRCWVLWTPQQRDHPINLKKNDQHKPFKVNQLTQAWSSFKQTGTWGQGAPDHMSPPLWATINDTRLSLFYCVVPPILLQVVKFQGRKEIFPDEAYHTRNNADNTLDRGTAPHVRRKPRHQLMESA